MNRIRPIILAFGLATAGFAMTAGGTAIAASVPGAATGDASGNAPLPGIVQKVDHPHYHNRRRHSHSHAAPRHRHRYDKRYHGPRYRYRRPNYGYYFGGWWYAVPWWLYSTPRRYYSSRHVEWCLGRYRSYNPATDMYLGYDGRYHRCRSPYR